MIYNNKILDLKGPIFIFGASGADFLQCSGIGTRRKGKVAKANEQNFYCNHMTTEKLKAVLAVRRNQGFQLQRYSKWKEEFDISGEENHHNINKVVA